MNTLQFVRDNWETISWIATAAALLYVKLRATVEIAQHKAAIDTVTRATEEEGAVAVKRRVEAASYKANPAVRRKIERSVKKVDPKQDDPPVPLLESLVTKVIR